MGYGVTFQCMYIMCNNQIMVIIYPSFKGLWCSCCAQVKVYAPYCGIRGPEWVWPCYLSRFLSQGTGTVEIYHCACQHSEDFHSIPFPQHWPTSHAMTFLISIYYPELLYLEWPSLSSLGNSLFILKSIYKHHLLWPISWRFSHDHLLPHTKSNTHPSELLLFFRPFQRSVQRLRTQIEPILVFD
jgi:hypothetical protein